MKPAIDRRLAVVTGGCGGMGIACAREFGRSHDLLLTDISAGWRDLFASCDESISNSSASTGSRKV